MPSLKDLRNRISSVKATRKITKAMQMVAAAKLRRAQEAALTARPYAERMDGVLANLASRVDKETAPQLLVGTGKDDVHMLVMMTAGRGLCGGFNANIAKLVRNDAKDLISKGKTVKIIAVGRKGAEILKREFERNIQERINLQNTKIVDFEEAEDIGKKVRDLFEAGEFDICTLYFSEFKSVISQVPTPLQLIPAKIPEPKEDGGKKVIDLSIYEYEPDEDVILDYLLTRNISTQVYRGLLENAASEQGARMTAMDNATRNASEMIDGLTLDYNRKRQAQITKELIEIISGAEAL